ncbi:MAG: outer membrane beta-barrel protein [Pseudomonadales bacterium]
MPKRLAHQLITGTLLVILGCPIAWADDGPGYTYIDLGYIRTDIDDLDENLDSLGLAASVAMTENFYLFADYEDGSAEIGNIDIDANTFDAGLGVNLALTDTVDLFGEASYVRAELEAGEFGDVDESGYGLSAGLRAMVLPQLELNAGLSYVDIDGLDDTSIDVGAVWRFTDVIALILGASFADDANSYGAGVRFYFDR